MLSLIQPVLSLSLLQLHVEDKIHTCPSTGKFEALKSCNSEVQQKTLH